jgi:hypothetical protein
MVGSSAENITVALEIPSGQNLFFQFIYLMEVLFLLLQLPSTGICNQITSVKWLCWFFL